MADIELVIKIDGGTYKNIIENGFIYDEDNEVVTHAIKNGISLPKGHGRLIDADALYDEYVKEPEEFNGGHSLMALFRVAPTIIEADKEHEDNTRPYYANE